MNLSVVAKPAANLAPLDKRLFAWRGEMPAPFATSGVLQFKLPQLHLFAAREVAVDRAFSNSILRFTATFCSLSISADMTPYHRAVAPDLVDAGILVPEEAMLLAWALIHNGLQKYANALGPYLATRTGDVPLPISPMHVWAICEAAKAFIGCVDPDGELGPYRALADTIMVATISENGAMHAEFSPYTNIFIEQ